MFPPAVRLVLCLLLALPVAFVAAADLPDRDGRALAAAIEAANARPGSAPIRLAAGGLYTFDGAAGTAALPTITGEVVIEGRGAEIRRYGKGPISLFEVAPGGRLTLRELTLAEGNLGAIRNHGTLILQRVQVVDCAGDGMRGVLVNFGTLLASDSLVAFNRVDGIGRDAGTLVNHGEMTLARTRIEHNRISRRWPAPAVAGAVLNRGLLRVEDLQLADNGIDDRHDGPAAEAILNLDGGRVVGQLAPGQLVEERQLVAR